MVNRNPYDYKIIEDAWYKENGGPAFTAVVDGKPIACAGVTISYPGVGYAWVVFSYDFPRHKLWITRTLRNAFRDIVNGCKLHRVEAQVLESQIAERRWIEMLGFTPEGIAHEYTHDRRNIVRYEWLRYRIQIRQLRERTIQFDELLRACDEDHLDVSEWFQDACILIATEDERYIGFAVHGYMASVAGHAAYGRHMAIHPDFRGRGLGEKLHVARLTKARKDGAKCFVGHIKGSNPALERIFRKYGANHPVESPLGTLYICRLEA